MGSVRKSEKNIPIFTNNLVNPFLNLHQEVDKAMNELSNWFGESKLSLKEFDNLTLKPAIDFVEDDKMLRIEAEMPGMGEKDIKVSIDNHMLTISGEKTTSKKDKGKDYSMREISYGHYERSLTLPDNLDLEKAKASFKKGMLWIEFPKKILSQSQPRTINIEKAKD